jgi:hypothetical protein
MSRLFFFLSLFFLISPAHAEVTIAESPNFSVIYDVFIKRESLGTPRVQMTIRGGDEVKDVTLVLEKDRYRHFRGDGTLTQLGSDIVWTPAGLVSRLEYESVLPHERRKGLYDSYGEKNWFITRTNDLFPHLILSYRKTAKSDTRVQFHLPKGWRAVAAMPEVTGGGYRARPAPDYRYEWPTGWLIFGDVVTEQAKARDVVITFAYPKGFVGDDRVSPVQGQPVRGEKFRAKIKNAIEIYEKVIPLMADFMPAYAKHFLVVYGKTPMWRGGLSGEDSLFINWRIRNLSHDFSSTLVHEYFHVSQGFKKDKRDGDWIVEGLAEYYSLRLLWEAGVITKEQFKTGVALYETEGRWGLNLSRSNDKRVIYNSVPLVMFTLDQMLQQKTGGKKSLKNVIGLLVERGEPVGTRLFQESLESLTGEPFKKVFQSHVSSGMIPEYKPFLEAL